MTTRRVILVGETGLDRALRDASDLDLVRVGHPFDAIGEIASHEHEPDAPGAVVIVGDARPAHATEFASSLRLVDPAVRIYAIENQPGAIEDESVAIDDEPGYDGMVDPTDPVRMIRNGRPMPTPIATPVAHDTHDAIDDEPDEPESGLPETGLPEADIPPIVGDDIIDGPTVRVPEDHGASRDVDPKGAPIGSESPAANGVHDRPLPRSWAEFEQSTPAITAPIESRIDSSIESSTTPVTDIGPAPHGIIDARLDDRSVVETMLRGGDVLASALDLLRERLDDPTVTWDDTPGAVGVRVGVDTITFGVLRASHTDDDVLASHASWFSAWIRLTKQHADLREAAFTDPLTGAHNRRYFERFVDRALSESYRRRHHMTLLVFDIDNFKTYNDEYGHGAGDEVLVEIVRLMQSCIRPSDRVCRIGGDEFAVIFHEPEGPRQAGSSHPDSITTIAARFQAALAQHRFPKLTREAPGALTISGGLATYPWDGRTWRELLECADERAIESKRIGKNAITIG